MSQGPLCPNLSQKVQKEVSQMANRNLSRVILLGGLSVNLNHLKMVHWGSAGINLIILVTQCCGQIILHPEGTRGACIVLLKVCIVLVQCILTVQKPLYHTRSFLNRHFLLSKLVHELGARFDTLSTKLKPTRRDTHVTASSSEPRLTCGNNFNRTSCVIGEACLISVSLSFCKACVILQKCICPGSGVQRPSNLCKTLTVLT